MENVRLKKKLVKKLFVVYKDIKMKLSEFLHQLHLMVDKDPELLDLEVITAKDDEGNGYNKVHYQSSVVFADYHMESVDEKPFDNSSKVVLLN